MSNLAKKRFMSRVGNSPITIPKGVVVNVEGKNVGVQGPLGSLSMDVRPEINVEIKNGMVCFSRQSEDKLAKSLHGLTRSLIQNLVNGVEKGWEKKLELVGIGYRASTSTDKLTLNVGYSHPVEIAAPAGITFKVEDNTKITVSGIDKNLVGTIAAKIRMVKPPEPYKGKGIRYSGEYVRRKAGKAGKVVGGVK